LHHAAALIRTGEKIEAVSLLVGYRSKKNFYRHFKDELGVTPTVYRTTVAGRMRRID
jgi:AraC-like DNA-binding protein